MNIVLISGSARVDSFNTALLKHFAKTYLSNDSFYIFDQIYALPIFSPSIEEKVQIKELQSLCEKIKVADYVLFSSPEYIHSIPGGLKNLFDWLVGTGVLDGKRTIIIVASSSDGQFAMTELKEILNVLTANSVWEEHSFNIPGIRTKFNTNLDLIDESIKLKFNTLYEALSQHHSK